MVNKETKKLWAEKTMELTNIGAGVLLFGQFVSNTGPKVTAMIAGAIFIALGYLASYNFLKTVKTKKKK
jgi:hypothetical protein